MLMVKFNEAYQLFMEEDVDDMDNYLNYLSEIGENHGEIVRLIFGFDKKFDGSVKNYKTAPKVKLPKLFGKN